MIASGPASPISPVAPRIGRLTLRVNNFESAFDRLTLDGEAMQGAILGTEIPINPGQHEVRVVRRPNGADRERPSQPPRRETSVIAMAASTGGPRAVRTILESLGEDFPAPILLVQHIGEDFAEGFARWLDATVPMDVRLAREGDRLRAGAVYLAPPRGHLTVQKGAIRVCDRAPIHGFRPSASATYASVARAYGERALGLILTGMGRDGVEGLRELHRRGGLVVAQDASTSVVDSMPASARRAGIVHEVLPLPDISAYLRSCVA